MYSARTPGRRTARPQRDVVGLVSRGAGSAGVVPSAKRGVMRRTELLSITCTRLELRGPVTLNAKSRFKIQNAPTRNPSRLGRTATRESGAPIIRPVVLLRAKIRLYAVLGIHFAVVPIPVLYNNNIKYVFNRNYAEDCINLRATKVCSLIHLLLRS